ncbi:hypothetical protein GALMADRAFT_721323 [Galerina marginata CBS 339.88]|uniref:Uncharacterized protein n=1 Tax=Galerina marginata (strain CBS 339.88) TaxID=685588 RepID=A0A067SQ89_GALM3|nr:hypothetical protein GALMADRAFT_721323 [Galerina marginata CBS 339.88]
MAERYPVYFVLITFASSLFNSKIPVATYLLGSLNASSRLFNQNPSFIRLHPHFNTLPYHSATGTLRFERPSQFRIPNRGGPCDYSQECR